MAQEGKYGSIGYRYPWSGEETRKLVLRTHTTAISANMLHKLAQQKGPDGRPPPARYFSIDRVFRNETVDATHLAEFHQVEGVIADYDLTLGGLMEVRFRNTLPCPVQSRRNNITDCSSLWTSSSARWASPISNTSVPTTLVSGPHCGLFSS